MPSSHTKVPQLGSTTAISLSLTRAYAEVSSDVESIDCRRAMQQEVQLCGNEETTTHPHLHGRTFLKQQCRSTSMQVTAFLASNRYIICTAPQRRSLLEQCMPSE